LGEHDVKFGVQYTKAEGNWQGGYFHNTFNYAYPYPYQNATPATDWWWNCDATWCWGTDDDPLVGWYNLRTESNPFLTVRESDSTGVFVDDTWIVSDRVTVNLGLRYDRSTAKYGEGAVYEPYDGPDTIDNPTFLRSRSGTGDLYDFETWAPRLGIAWTITGDGKTVLRSHLGRYFSPVGVESLTRFGPDMPLRQRYYEWYDIMLSEVDLNDNGYLDSDEVWYGTRLLQGRTPDRIDDDGLQDNSWEFEVAPGTGNTYVDQFNLSIQRQLGRDFALELSYVYKKTNDLIVLQPYNEATGEYWEWEQVPYTTTTGQQTNAYEIVLRDYDGSGAVDFDDVQFVLDNTHYRAVNAQDFAGQDVNRTYNGLQLTLNKRYSNRWQMLASINYTDSDGFVPRQIDQDWYIDAPVANDTRAGTSPNHFVNNLEGPLLMTPEWMFKLAGSYRIPVIETDLGVRVRYDSGRPVFQTEELPTYRTWMSDFQEGVFLSTGSHDFMVSDDPNDPDWTPSTTLIDLSLNKSFKLGDFGDLAISLDALNVTNEGSPSRVGFDAADYGRVYAVVFPRRYRAGLKFSF
jgi:outer membrane receptor protein involved in Fe transport